MPAVTVYYENYQIRLLDQIPPESCCDVLRAVDWRTSTLLMLLGLVWALLCFACFRSACFSSIHHALVECLLLLAVFLTPSGMVLGDSYPLWNLRCWYNSETSPIVPKLLCTWKIFLFHINSHLGMKKKVVLSAGRP